MEEAKRLSGADARASLTTGDCVGRRFFSIWPAMRLAALPLILLLLFVSRAAGQADDRWLILPVTTGPSDAWIEPTAERIHAELAKRGVDSWSLAAAKRQFEVNGSAPAAEVSDGDVQRWVDQSSKAIRNLAEGDYTKALNQLKEAQALSRSAAEELNREHDRAQRMLDTCLYMVRVWLDTGAESRARSLAQECRQLVPRVEPTRYMHPPAVRELLREVDASRAAKPRRLNVDSAPSGCAVRVNGVLLGKTPLELRDLFPGKYRVQVECEPGGRGRVHIADVTTSSASVFVDARFDRTVSTEPILHLQYEDAADETKHGSEDAGKVSKVVPAQAVLILRRTGPSVLELDLIGGSRLRQLGLVRVSTGPEAPSVENVALAVGALIDGKCTDYTSEPPVSLPCDKEGRRRTAEAVPEDADEGWPARRMPKKPFKAGVALATIGSASLITGYVLLAPRQTAANDWLDALPSASAQNKWIRFDNSILWTSGAGATLLVTSMPMVLPKHRGVPWAAWLSGAVGVGALAFSLGYGLTGDDPPQSCRGATPIAVRADAEACITRAERVSGAYLAGVSAAPLITIPLVYLLRRSDKKLQPEVEASGSSAYLGLRGSW